MEGIFLLIVGAATIFAIAFGIGAVGLTLLASAAGFFWFNFRNFY